MLLATIGYEGMEQVEFIETLKQAGVETLVDVRELPLSRKKGFSKKALEAAVIERGLQYVHFGALGSPREARHFYHEDGDWQKFSREYRAHLNSQGAEIEKLMALIRHSFCCLMCFEADYRMCHRSLLAFRLRVEVEELTLSHLAKPGKATAAWLVPSVGIPAQR